MGNMNVTRPLLLLYSYLYITLQQAKSSIILFIAKHTINLHEAYLFLPLLEDYLEQAHSLVFACK